MVPKLCWSDEIIYEKERKENSHEATEDLLGIIIDFGTGKTDA